MSGEALIHTDRQHVGKFLADLANCLEQAESVTDEDFAAFYGFDTALDWVISTLEDYTASLSVGEGPGCRLMSAGGATAPPPPLITAQAQGARDRHD